MSAHTHPLLYRLQRLNELGIALSAERNPDKLLEEILRGAISLTNADGGTLYLLDEEQKRLCFSIVITQSLNIFTGGTSGKPVNIVPLDLYDAQGLPVLTTVAVHAALKRITLHVTDVYGSDEFDFSRVKAFDKAFGYRTHSLLAVPLIDHQNDVIGVLQLINALDNDGKPRTFASSDAHLAESLASQAAVALTNRRLIDEQKALFDAVIEMIATAIDEKSPYTGGHCRRVPEIAHMIAEAACNTRDGPLASFQMQDADFYELRVAALLHDCGKVTTPVHVMDKSTKLYTLVDRIEHVETRLELLRRDRTLLALQRRFPEVAQALAADVELQEELADLDQSRTFLRRVNVGGERMTPEDQQRVRALANRYLWQDNQGVTQPMLTPNEVENLNIARGTLTLDERKVIENHVTVTIKMLSGLPFPKHLRQVPEFAGGHHERTDGTGYPLGLRGEQMSVQARIMAVADIFEALTAHDRPYKKPMPLSQSLEILCDLCRRGQIDKDIFRVFVQQQVYLTYARKHLSPEQIDCVDESKLLCALEGAAPTTPAPIPRCHCCRE